MPLRAGVCPVVVEECLRFAICEGGAARGSEER